MFYEEWREVKKLLGKAKTLCDQGGDWERKNKLKVRGAGGMHFQGAWRTEGDRAVGEGSSRALSYIISPFLPPQVYDAVFATYTRDFKTAASLFLEALATFTA